MIKSTKGRKNNFAGSPIESKIIELKKAKYIQEQEFTNYLRLKKERAEEVIQSENAIFASIPSSVISLKAKKDFAASRKTLIVRAVKIQAENKLLSTWTIPKMIVKSKLLEKKQIQDQIELENARKYKLALTAHDHVAEHVQDPDDLNDDDNEFTLEDED